MLLCHSGNIWRQDTPAEMALEGPGKEGEGTLGLTLFLCCFSGIWGKNVVSDFVDCQNEARWQWIKCNTDLLFLGSQLCFPWSKRALPTLQPQPHASLATTCPFPWVPKYPALKGGKRVSFILVRAANWKLLTEDFSCLGYSPRACLPCSPFNETRAFCNWSDQFACLSEAAG